MEAATVWRGQTMGDRAAERRQRFLDAAYDLLGTEGAPATTMRAICRRANLSQKYFYESFGNRDEVLELVHTRVVEGIVDAVRATPQEGAPEQRVRAVFLAAGQYFEEDPRRVRIAFREALSDDVIRENAAVIVPAVVLHVAAHLSSGGSEFEFVDDDPSLTIASLAGSFVGVYLSWLDGRVSTDRERVADHCTRLVMASPGIVLRDIG